VLDAERINYSEVHFSSVVFRFYVRSTFPHFFFSANGQDSDILRKRVKCKSCSYLWKQMGIIQRRSDRCKVCLWLFYWISVTVTANWNNCDLPPETFAWIVSWLMYSNMRLLIITHAHYSWCMDRVNNGLCDCVFVEWQWHQLDHMQIICRQITRPALHLFLWGGCSFCCPTNSVKALKAQVCESTWN